MVRLIIYLLAIHQLLFWTYIWQLKEYRWDRWWDWLKSNNDWWWAQFDVRKWYRPKFTLRASLIVVGGLLLMPWVWMAIPLVVIMLVWMMWPIFYWQKKRLVNRAKCKMRDTTGKVIGVTGSYGKSTTKQLLVDVLSQGFNNLVYTPNNVNTEIGVAQTVLGWPDFEVAVVEMGAYKIGEIKAICDIVNPQYGIITGLGDQHLSLFGSLENIKKAKYELIESLPVEGKGWVVEKDFSINEAKNIEVHQSGVSFDFEETKFEVPLLGKQLISNVIVVIKVAKELGMKMEVIKRSLKNINVDKYWPKKYKVNERLTVIDNSYNASVESFLSILDYVKTWKNTKKILVTPGMIELGSNSRSDHTLIGKNLKNIDLVLLTHKKYFSELNQWSNVKVVEVNRVYDEIIKNCSDKTVVIFKSRIDRRIINRLINEQSN